MLFLSAYEMDLPINTLTCSFTKTPDIVVVWVERSNRGVDQPLGRKVDFVRAYVFFEVIVKL